MLWYDLKVNAQSRENGGQDTQFVFLDIIVDGETSGQPWSCGLEFYYANPESIYCRPLRDKANNLERMPIPELAIETKSRFFRRCPALRQRNQRYNLVELQSSSVKVKLLKYYETCVYWCRRSRLTHGATSLLKLSGYLEWILQSPKGTLPAVRLKSTIDSVVLSWTCRVRARHAANAAIVGPSPCESWQRPIA